MRIVLIITDFKEQLKSIFDELMGIEVEATYLFGSYAKDKVELISDVDIRVLTKRIFQKRLKNRYEYYNTEENDFEKRNIVKKFGDMIKKVIKEQEKI